MIVNNIQSMLQPDGSLAYVVNGIYTAVHGDPVFSDVQAWLAAGNKAQPYVPPAPVPIDPDVQLSAEIIQDYIDQQKQTKKWQDRKAEILKAGDA